MNIIRTARPVWAALATLLSALLLASGLAPAAQAHERTTGPNARSAERVSLAKVRAATAKYHNVDTAVADGFMPTDACAELPGVGGMGYHYANLANILDGVLDPERPEVLVYVPQRNGRLRLGAAEYFQPDADQNLATDSDRPSLLGHDFDGPMAGHEPGMPIHYDLHVWIGKRNPAGMFAAWNPDVSCPA